MSGRGSRLDGRGSRPMRTQNADSCGARLLREAGERERESEWKVKRTAPVPAFTSLTVSKSNH